jgi:Ca2+-binding EF-hand superfamily protein
VAFFLFDSNRDGCITLDEMFHLLDSLFTVVFRFIPQLSSRVGGATSEELALATARQCFAHADLNRSVHSNTCFLIDSSSLF